MPISPKNHVGTSMTAAVTLSPATPSVTLSGSINAFSTIGTYALNGSTVAIGAALFGPSPTVFSVVNTGIIDSTGSNPWDAGIVLAASGTVGNAGTIDAATGILILGAGAKVTNSNLITARGGDGIELAAGAVINAGSIAAYYNGISVGAGNVLNSGTITAFYDGIYTAAGNVLNTATIEAGLGIFQRAGTGANAGYIKGVTANLRHGPGPFAGTGITTYGHFTNEQSGTIIGTDAVQGFGNVSTGMIGDGAAVLYNDGQVTAATGIGLAVGASLYNAGTIKGTYAGVDAGALYPGTYNSGYIANYQTGRITGGETGVEIKYSQAILYNAGSIAGGTIGVRASGNVINLGRITGGRTGDDQYAGTLYNAGLIQGRNGAGAITNLYGEIQNQPTGTITGKIGVALQYGGYIFNSGQLTGSKDGVSITSVRHPVRTYPTGSYIYNYGTITGGQYGILINAGKSFGLAGIYNDGGTIAGETGLAIYTGDVYNSGLIEATSSFGVELTGSGAVNNSVTGTIAAAGIGVALGPAATLTNQGQISGAQTGVTANLATVTNTGAITSTNGTGVALSADASLYNRYTMRNFIRYSGTITGATYGVSLAGAGYIYNNATISGRDAAIYLRGLSAAARAAGQYAYVYNNGTIYGSRYGIVSRYGTIDVYNSAFGRICGLTGIRAQSAQLYVHGDIYGTRAGIVLAQGGYIQDDGGISSNDDRGDTALYAGAAGGTVIGDGDIEGGVGIVMAGPGYIHQSGHIFGAFSGIYFQNGGTIINRGEIGASAGYTAISINGGGTIVNQTYAQIYGNIVFGPGANRLVLQPGATIQGGYLGFSRVAPTVNLGGGTLELAAQPGHTGTLAAFEAGGASELTIDTGANWTFTAGSYLAATIAVTNDGTLKQISGSGPAIAGAVAGTGLIDITAGTLTLDGAVASGQTVAFFAGAGVLALGDPGAFAATISNFGLGETIDLTGIATIESLTFHAGVLTVSAASGTYDFTFANPSAFSGETFAAFTDSAGTGITLSSAARMSFLAPAGSAAGPAISVISYALPARTLGKPTAYGISFTAAASGWLGRDSILPTLSSPAPVTFQS